MDEVDFAGKKGLYLRITLAHEVFRAPYGRIYAPHDRFQEIKIALIAGHHSLPVPLIYVKRVQVVKFFVGSYGVHVGINAVSRFYGIVCKREAFPLGKRMNHLGPCVAKVFYRKCHGTLNAIQVVVYAEPLQHEQRSGDAAQAQLG